jgi:hypothetical protein
LIFVSGTFREPADPRRPRGSVSFYPGYAPVIGQQRALPRMDQIAVAAGLLVAVTLATLIRLWGPSPASSFGIAAPLSGIALGALLAGKMAKNGGIYHGALVGVGYVVVEAIGLAPSPLEPASAGLTEGLTIIAGDALLLGVAAVAGWIAAPLARPSSSSGKDRGR